MGHDHTHGTGMQHRGRLLVVLGLTLSVLVLQAVVAVITGSLALLADAGHMLSDSIGLVLALAAITVAQLGGAPGSRRTFGYHRTEVLAAGANGLLLLGVAGWVVVSAVGRLGDAPTIEATPVLAAGVVGLVVNLIGLQLLRAGSKESLNVRGAYLEVLGDALGSVAVIASAAVIAVTGWYAADAVASLLIAVMIVPRALSLLREVAGVLLEGSPAHVDLAELRAHILGIDGVADVHDLHVWTITSGMPVMSAHIVVEDTVTDLAEAHGILDRLSACLSDHFDVEHSTFQLEPIGHAQSEAGAHH
ncbi:cation diffusion facilitator family transporter [Aeromicrobium marinum DSM 15272]|uniref:Cation diffusion facilitator family transporter n=1 Tax=Aeromicrobium marinum DSM 15272 TaxID=585531 RepID=E2SG92_9ACTN|nr:cation diffusion facilitator family transporter [Aeromicrobium marinum]EFQ81849.1 cation diffusion facilitator family transporter [Aeromicrobium marinum DSM 15272]